MVSGAVTVTVTDDEGTPVFSVADAEVVEGDGDESDIGETELMFTVTLSPAADRPTTVDWVTSDGTAMARRDYTAENSNRRFAAGETEKAVTVMVFADGIVEDTETLTVTLSNPTGGATLGTAIATGTIIDDDALGLALLPSSVTVTEASGTGRTATYTVALMSQPTAAVTVSVASEDGTVASVNLASLTFATNTYSIAQTVTVTGMDDNVDNASNRTANIVHVASGGDYGMVSGAVTVTVTDDEDISAFSMGDAEVKEGDEGETELVFTVTLSPAADRPVSVDWATSDGTAKAGMDYTAGSGTLTFNSSDTEKAVTVTVFGDTFNEGTSETLTVTLSNQTGNTRLTKIKAVGRGTITDDDEGDPTAYFESTSLEVKEGQTEGDLSFNINLILSTNPSSSTVINLKAVSPPGKRTHHCGNQLQQ